MTNWFSSFQGYLQSSGAKKFYANIQRGGFENLHPTQKGLSNY